MLPLVSTMPDRPLSIRSILEHAVAKHPRKGVIARDGDRVVRQTYPQLAKRVAKLANALAHLGVKPGDRVASFAWNGHRHLELYYAVPMMGAVLHTVNIRLFPNQVAELLDHADDRVVLFDVSLTAAVRAFSERGPQTSRVFVAMGETNDRLDGALDYEALLAEESESYAWPDLDERTGAILCYTSATTGDPKGVLFSHRSTYLHAMASALPDYLSVRENDRIMPIVPMFHVNAWGLPFIAPLVGADLVMPMERLDPQGVVELCRDERVTLSAGVPTVWMGVRDLLRAKDARLPTLERVVIGGSAMPRSLADDLSDLGVEPVHAWGMTEMSPLGTVSSATSTLEDDPDRQKAERYKVGRFSPIVEWKLVDEHGAELPADGIARGELLVRGHAVTASYYHNERATAAAFEPDGWFHTGDIVTVDEYGYLDIVDRVKDFIKSGGEWISSVELENAMMSHPAVREACAFGIPHPKWQERPVAAVVVREGHTVNEEQLRGFLAAQLSKWQIPDRVLFVDAIPRTGVGKFLKRDLRTRYERLFTDEERRSNA